MPPRLKLEGEKFGRLSVIKYIGLFKRKAVWLCKCDCGNFHRTNTCCLRSGESKSCGCLQKEIVRETKQTHGLAKINGKVTRFYYTYYAMRERCLISTHPSYKNYGGRGIKVCRHWMNFKNFRDDMYQSFLEHFALYGSRNTTIERINNNGNYELTNCKWVTQKEQHINQRHHNQYTK